MLVCRPPFLGYRFLKMDGIDLGDHGYSFRHCPPIKRPEVDPIPGILFDSLQPGEPSVGGAGHLSLDVELEDRLRR